MKKKFMRTKIMAMAMAAALGAAGAVATAQAAAVAAEDCPHVNSSWRGSGQHAEFYDRQKHILFNDETYYCYDCDDLYTISEMAGFEDHDYEQIYYEDGTGLTYCTRCDDSYPF